jgi:hypothetical protein
MNEPKPHYMPISVDDVADYDPMKGAIRAKKIIYKLADGTVSYVTLPLESYTKEAVDKALQEAADHHVSVMSIRGVPGPALYAPVTDPFA